MKKLNRSFRGINKATDVLSFAAPRALSKQILGSIVIDLDTARRQAQDLGHSLKREVEELTIHGVLHLLGYDHEKKSEAYVMQNLEIFFRDRLLS